MSDKWIRFNKGLLIFSMIASFFFVIFLTVFFADDKCLGSDAWMVFVGGVVAVTIEHAVWGLFIEIASNIYHSSKKSNVSLSNEDPENANEENVNNNNAVVIAKSSWICKKCGTSNNDVLNCCTRCGNTKE
ncbi:MAG: hypothetical protein HDT44_01895 [Ruminococcaceae bacterium]|nr:hypothetical protein [Oscillospiraceae bacterium]